MWSSSPGKCMICHLSPRPDSLRGLPRSLDEPESVSGAGWTVAFERRWVTQGPHPFIPVLGLTRRSVQRVPGLLSLGTAAVAWR
jgi:hypothetical protein